MKSDEPRFSPVHDLPAFDGDPRTYVIASTPRSGSSLLARLVESGGDAGVPSEYLNSGKHVPELGEHWGAIQGGTLLLDVYLREMLRRRTTPNGVFGLKAHWSQLAEFLPHSLVAERLAKARFVWIRRRDLLGQALSLTRAHQTGQWSAGRPATGEPAYDARAIDRALKDLATADANWRLFFAQNAVPRCEVWYEDLVEDPAGVVAQVRAHLGLEPAPAGLELSDAGMKRQADALTRAWRERYLREAGRLPGAPHPEQAESVRAALPIRSACARSAEDR